PVMVAAVYATVGRLGFYPTDEGLLQAYTYRILHGQVPHRDFISPRPLGSALLHIVDFAVPGPLFEVSRVIALCEYAGFAVAFAWLLLLPRLGRAGVASTVRTLLWTGVVSALPTIAFVGAISAVGGFQALRTQLLGAAFIYGRPLLAVWSPHQDLLVIGPLVA